MNGNSVLVGLVLLMAFCSCDRPPEGTVERRFELPDSLGTFSIWLDSNLTRMDSGLSHSCTKCDDLLRQSQGMKDWAIVAPSLFGTMDPSKDSLFAFTWSINRYSPADCDSAQTVQDWFKFELWSRRLECRSCAPVDSGIVQVGGTQWAFIQYSDSISAHNDILMCYTRTHGRGMYIHWQRIAPTTVSFDFGSYALRQLATAKFD